MIKFIFLLGPLEAIQWRSRVDPPVVRAAHDVAPRHPAAALDPRALRAVVSRAALRV